MYCSVKGLILVRLYKSAESYCYHLGVGLSFGVTLEGLRQNFYFNFIPQQPHTRLYYIQNGVTIAVRRTLETVDTFYFTGGKVYSLNKECHN